jgi:hypothetical protein
MQPHAKAWIGVKDLNKKSQEKEEIFETYIKKLVRHAYSYLGGATYGTFGGYDISLAKFRAAVPRAMGQPACLPTPSFRDEGVKASRDVSFLLSFSCFVHILPLIKSLVEILFFND